MGRSSPEAERSAFGVGFEIAFGVELDSVKKGLRLVIPTGVNASSWPILLRLCGIPQERLYRIGRRFGHTIAADSFLLLEEARASGCLASGMRVLLFAYGFGSSWCALLLEIVEEELS